MARDMEPRSCDGDDDDVLRCDGCGGVLEPGDDDEPLVIYECFHVLHAACAHGRDACPRCHTPRRVPDDDGEDQPEHVDEATPASQPPPDNNPDEDAALASDGDGESPGSGCSHAAWRLGCACRRVAELESRVEENSAALTETAASVLELELEMERAQSRLCRIEEKLEEEEEIVRRRDDNDKRAREEIEDAEERKKPGNGGPSMQDQTD